MKKLGYIISSRKQDDVASFVEKVSNKNDIDSTKPYIIVGWKQAQKDKNYKSILNKSLTNIGFWTFSRTEKRSEYEEDLQKFIEFCIRNETKHIKYYYVNPFKLSLSQAKRLYNILFNSKTTSYICNGALYVHHTNYVLGIDFNILEYMGIDIKKLYSRLYKNQFGTIYKDDNQEIRDIKNNLTPKEYYLIPYLMSE